MENLEHWSSVVEKNMARFDDAVNRLKSTISNVEKKQEAKAKKVSFRNKYSKEE